LCVLTMELD